MRLDLYPILSIGFEIGDRLETIGYECEAKFNLPSFGAGINTVLQEIVFALEIEREQHKIK